MKLNRIALGIAAGVALVLGASSAANADLQSIYTYASIQRSIAYYNTGLHRVSITDAYNDGWGARVRWQRRDGLTGRLDNTQGAISTVTGYPGTESREQIRIKACSINNGVELNCVAYTAFGPI